jgi:hypothetical protein
MSNGWILSALPRILTLYSWIAVGALIYILIQIARFYEIKHAELHKGRPRQRTYYAVFVVPLLLFGFAAGRYAWYGDLAGDALGDLAFLVGGAVLSVSSYYLYRLMTGRRQ